MYGANIKGFIDSRQDEFKNACYKPKQICAEILLEKKKKANHVKIHFSCRSGVCISSDCDLFKHLLHCDFGLGYFLSY